MNLTEESQLHWQNCKDKTLAGKYLDSREKSLCPDMSRVTVQVQDSISLTKAAQEDG